MRNMRKKNLKTENTINTIRNFDTLSSYQSNFNIPRNEEIIFRSARKAHTMLSQLPKYSQVQNVFSPRNHLKTELAMNSIPNLRSKTRNKLE